MSHDTKRWTIELDEVEYTFMTQEEYDVEVWTYPGRNVEFLTTWPEDLKFYAFDYYLHDYMTKEERQVMLDECMS